MGAEPARGQRQRTIIFVPFPAQGHITPMLHLACALAVRGDVDTVTVAVPDFVHRRMGVVAGVSLAAIPSGVPDDGGDEPPDFASIVHAMEDHMPGHLEGMLAATQRRLADRGGLVSLVVDVLASWALPVAARCGVPAVGFWPVMFASYRVVAAIPELISKGFISKSGVPVLSSQKHANGEDEDKECSMIKELGLLPAKLELTNKDLPWLVGDAASQQSRFAFWLRTMDRAKSLRSILVNSFAGEDAGDDSGRFDPPQGQRILHVGPLFNNDSLDRPKDIGSSCLSCRKSTAGTMWQADSVCMDWLDRQRPGSVIYVSFGSWVAPIVPDKITAFARGLEAAGRPFLWVLKDHPSWRAGLPENFADDVAELGRIVSWAPQEDVLKHESVGCYITHCGWNSVLEAIRCGVRMICYPISGDQFINSAYIVKWWEAGIPLTGTDHGDVKDCIERVMEGDEGTHLQKKVKELRETIRAGAARNTARNVDLFVNKIDIDI